VLKKLDYRGLPPGKPHQEGSERESVNAFGDDRCLQTDLVGAGRPIPVEVGAGS